MMPKGIIDPTKVARSIAGRASIAGLLITTEAMVADVPKKEVPAMPGGGGMGGWAVWVEWVEWVEWTTDRVAYH